ncbi:putative diguanylate cyclase YedQ [Raoultella terrigena]|nr:putative diguanylate cyclase YedQ [Raoultella terrigena]
MVLEEAYVDNQHNNLENVAHEMDGLLQFNTDRMIFFPQRDAVGAGNAARFYDPA